MDTNGNLRALLLKDLCGRLPYGVKTKYKNIIMEVFVISSFLNNMCCLRWDNHKGYYNQTYAHIGEFKPYLRPMSTMTQDEFEEFTNIVEHISIGKLQMNIANPEVFDWLNKHHFDYRGLIEKNLALDCTGLHIYD